MIATTYRGVRLKVKKGREWGYLAHFVNGKPWGEWIGSDEQAAIRLMQGYVDMAAARPDAFEPMWHPR